MTTITHKMLKEHGPKFALTLLIQALKSGEPFVVYNKIKSVLENELHGVIFSTKIGIVAGTLMDQIHETSPKAPLINMMITGSDGIPGKGVSAYIKEKYNRDWEEISPDDKLELVEKERKLIYKYGVDSWKKIAKKLYGNGFDKIKLPKSDEKDYDPNTGGTAGGESSAHKTLKEWVSRNPGKIGVSPTYGHGEVESRLLSGDEVDVMFSEKNRFRAVEVKSIISTDDDFKRGIYQCVKYREVKRAEHTPFEVDVESILVTERRLPPELLKRAKALRVRCVTVQIPSQKKSKG